MTAIKSRKASVALASIAVVFALLGTGCSVSPADNFTGDVKVEKTYKWKKKCYADVVLPDGQKGDVKISNRWMGCGDIKDGSTIRLEDGNYVK